MKQYQIIRTIRCAEHNTLHESVAYETDDESVAVTALSAYNHRLTKRQRMYWLVSYRLVDTVRQAKEIMLRAAGVLDE